jgi:flagellar hook-associated protein FlgK
MSKYEDANLILKLYDLRREAVMREARNWWFTFNPTSVQDFTDVFLGEQSAYFRMVVSYWEMAASLVNNGAIDEKMFNEANGEHIFIFSKVQPFLTEMRNLFNLPEYLEQFEKLVMRTQDIEKRLVELRERMTQFAALREQKALAQAQAAASAT